MYLMAATQRKLKEAVNAGDFAIIQLYSGRRGAGTAQERNSYKITTEVEG